MRSLRRPASPIETVVDPLRDFLKRRAVEFAGFALVAGAAAMVVALASWSIDDPSLNHATNHPARNLLGFPGAVASDVAMQLFGLGSIGILLAPAIWGWRLMRLRQFGRPQLRIALWIIGTGCGSAVASALPPTARWPLPGGLGGVVGDALLAAARAVSGGGTGVAAVVIGLAFIAATILAQTGACGFLIAEEEEDSEELDPFCDGPRAGMRRDEEEPSLGLVSLGALAHGFMSVKAAMARRLQRWQEDRAAARAELAYAGASPALAARRAFSDASEAPPPWAAEAAARGRRSTMRDEDDDASGQEPDAPVAAAAPRPRVSLPPRAERPAPRRETPPADPQSYALPSLDLLAAPPAVPASATISKDALEQNATLLEATLQDFGVRGEIIAVRPGPVVTLYELEPAPGTKSSRVISLADDIARSMSAVSARVAVVAGRNAIGIELPNAKRETVYLRALLAVPDFVDSRHKLALCLGKTIGGEPVIADLARMPHLLVAGTTGSGKSVAINTMILSLLYRLRPEECRLIMVDPKMLELSIYDGIPHLLSPVVTDPKKAVIALKWAVREMEERYKKMSKVGVRNIDGFNARLAEARAKGEVLTRTVQTGFDRETGEAVYEDEVMDLAPLPYIVVIVDEMADLMMVAGKDIEGAIQRLAQMARAAGIHLIMATQRPSVDVITGTIKANFPTRISFQVTSKIDSRTILGEMGAEQLLGQGDMLHMAGGGRITRVHGPFCSDAEVEAVVAHLKRQGRPAYLEAVTAEDDAGAAGTAGGGNATADSPVFDRTAQGSLGSQGAAPGEPGEGDLYEQAVAVVLRDQKASTSYIQRRLQIGYNRAASLMERMENEGIVGQANHAGKREILVEAEAHEEAAYE